MNLLEFDCDEVVRYDSGGDMSPAWNAALRVFHYGIIEDMQKEMSAPIFNTLSPLYYSTFVAFYKTRNWTPQHSAMYLRMVFDRRYLLPVMFDNRRIDVCMRTSHRNITWIHVISYSWGMRDKWKVRIIHFPTISDITGRVVFLP